jgi:hypothetical protein
VVGVEVLVEVVVVGAGAPPDGDIKSTLVAPSSLDSDGRMFKYVMGGCEGLEVASNMLSAFTSVSSCDGDTETFSKPLSSNTFLSVV